MGKSLYDLRPNIDGYGLIPILRKVWETGVPDVFPVKLYQDDNFPQYYENFIFKLPSGEIVTLYNDLTEQQKTVDTLRKSEEKFRALATNSPEHLLIQDKALRYLWRDEPAAGPLGSEDDRENRRRTDVPPRMRPILTRIKRRVLDTGKTEFVKASLTGLDGKNSTF